MVTKQTHLQTDKPWILTNLQNRIRPLDGGSLDFEMTQLLPLHVE